MARMKRRRKKKKTLADRVVDVCLEELVLGELALPVGGEPDLGQGALFGEDGLRVEHGCVCV